MVVLAGTFLGRVSLFPGMEDIVFVVDGSGLCLLEGLLVVVRLL